MFTELGSAVKTNRLIVAAAQMKFRAALKDNVVWITDTIHAAAKGGADVILFPECAVTGYNIDFAALAPKEVERALEAIGIAARQARCHVLVGSPTFAGRKRFNSLMVFDRRGRRVFCYSKIHLTAGDATVFMPGNTLAFFHLDGVACTAIICHERRFPELVRLPTMMGAQIVFHPNAGLDSLAVSKGKRHGRDGIAVRAFENQIYYVFANSVGPQDDERWSAGDSKIVAPDSSVLALANNRDEMVIRAELDLGRAGRQYAREALEQPVFLRRHWKAMIDACKRQIRNDREIKSKRAAPKAVK
jgi:predicted amidohydrolase